MIIVFRNWGDIGLIKKQNSGEDNPKLVNILGISKSSKFAWFEKQLLAVAL